MKVLNVLCFDSAIGTDCFGSVGLHIAKVFEDPHVGMIKYFSLSVLKVHFLSLVLQNLLQFQYLPNLPQGTRATLLLLWLTCHRHCHSFLSFLLFQIVQFELFHRLLILISINLQHRKGLIFLFTLNRYMDLVPMDQFTSLVWQRKFVTGTLFFKRSAFVYFLV